MFASVIALSLIQSAATPPASPQNLQGWNVQDNDRGCAVHAAYRGGTNLSVFALPDGSGIGFLIQNRDWTTLEDGRIYPLSVRFDDGARWPVPALARLEIDEQGPGLFFAIRPGSDEAGADFMVQFAAASGMDVTNDGARVDRLTLTNNRAATEALVQCIGRLWSDEPANPFRDTDSAHTARRI